MVSGMFIAVPTWAMRILPESFESDPDGALKEIMFLHHCR